MPFGAALVATLVSSGGRRSRFSSWRMARDVDFAATELRAARPKRGVKFPNGENNGARGPRPVAGGRRRKDKVSFFLPLGAWRASRCYGRTRYREHADNVEIPFGCRGARDLRPVAIIERYRSVLREGPRRFGRGVAFWP
jgi:hypothetical protein